MHFVYIVRCRDRSFYIGYARDPRARVAQHNAGKGAKYTRGRRPVELVYSEECATVSAALKREYALKQLSRAGKLRLIRQRRSRSRRTSTRRPRNVVF